MKKITVISIAVLLIGALCAACTPGSIIDTLNGLGATPGNACGRVTPTPDIAYMYASPSNAAASPSNALGALMMASPSNAQ